MIVNLPPPNPAPPTFRPGVYKDSDDDLWLCSSEDRNSWVCIRVAGSMHSSNNANIQKNVDPPHDLTFVSSSITLSF